eukprot:3091781-Pyramimonas_sp.AAC.1
MQLFRPRSLMTWHGHPIICPRHNRLKLGFPSHRRVARLATGGPRGGAAGAAGDGEVRPPGAGRTPVGASAGRAGAGGAGAGGASVGRRGFRLRAARRAPGLGAAGGRRDSAGARAGPAADSDAAGDGRQELGG